MEGLLISIRLYLGGVLLLAGLAKTVKRAAFANAVAAYGILPPGCVPAFTRVLPAVEVALGACLISGRLAPWPGIATTGLFSLFTLAVVLRLLAGRTSGPCGCGVGKGTARLGVGIVLRNLFLIALSVAATGRGAMELYGVVSGASVFILWFATALATRRRSQPALAVSAGRSSD